MTITWTPANRGLLARATACLAINRAVGFPEDAAQVMTVVNLAEGNGFLDIVGPITKRADGLLQVGNKNGTVDVSAWQINGAPEDLTSVEYARRAFVLWAQRQFRPWYAYKNRATNTAWPLFEEIVAEAVRVSALPARWQDAKSRRRTS